MLTLLKNKYFVFFFICAMLAIMDGINFTLPHNNGFFSLTYGEGSSPFDAWHIAKILVLAVIALKFIWKSDEINWQMNGLRLLTVGFIAFITQLFIYNFLFKLL